MKLQLLFLVIRTTLQFYAFVYLVVHALVLFWPPITSYLIFQNYSKIVFLVMPQT